VIRNGLSFNAQRPFLITCLQVVAVVGVRGLKPTSLTTFAVLESEPRTTSTSGQLASGRDDGTVVTKGF
jgi:hypothetical protein